MDFTEYLARDDAKSLTQLAEETGVSLSRLSQLKSKGGWTAELALDMERATGGLVDAGRLSATVKRARAPMQAA